MKSKLSTFLKTLEGNWISQKTIYYLRINQICFNQFKYSIYNDECYLQYYKNCIKKVNTYKFNQVDQNNSGKIKKNNNLNNYQYSIYKDKYLKIQYIDITKNIEYIEYINTINEKFIINITFLKRSNKYIAISFSSNIKIQEIDSR